MTSPSRRTHSHTDKGDYGFARVRDKAFDAVHDLWTKRKSQGVLLKDVASSIGRDTGWVSKQLSGPGNWTLRTFGELVEALNGEAEITVFGFEDSVAERSNFDAYTVHSERPLNRITVRTVYEHTKLEPQTTARAAKVRLELEPAS